MATRTTPAQTIPAQTVYECDCCGKTSTNDILLHNLKMVNRITYHETRLGLCTPCGTVILDGIRRLFWEHQQSQQKA